jgi:hypothetical protein
MERLWHRAIAQDLSDALDAAPETAHPHQGHTPMTDKNRARELLALADRCEAATGPDRELDALIWCAMQGVRYISHNPTYAGHGEGDDTQVEYVEPPKRTRRVSGKSRPHAKPFTASLDATMTLIENWNPPFPINVTMATAYGSASVMPNDGHSTGIHDQRGGHAHLGRYDPPRALCAAALRAIAQTEVPNDL